MSVNKIEYFSKLKELFEKMENDILDRRHLYGTEEIFFVLSVLKAKDYKEYLSTQIPEEIKTEREEKKEREKERKTNKIINNKIRKIKLFGFLPFLIIKRRSNVVKVKLFGIPIIKIKNYNI